MIRLYSVIHAWIMDVSVYVVLVSVLYSVLCSGACQLFLSNNESICSAILLSVILLSVQVLFSCPLSGNESTYSVIQFSSSIW